MAEQIDENKMIECLNGLREFNNLPRRIDGLVPFLLFYIKELSQWRRERIPNNDKDISSFSSENGQNGKGFIFRYLDEVKIFLKRFLFYM